jgi:hypothetical protein
LEESEDNVKQFSIRDLLFLIAIFALALGWWLDRRPSPARFVVNTTANRVYLLDNATGEVWSQRVEEDGDFRGDEKLHRLERAD